MANLSRCKEYLTVGCTLEELRQREREMRAAGFRKRRNGSGQAKTTTKEFYQWWDRVRTIKKVSRQREYQIKLRAQHRCIVCGQPAAPSTRNKDGYSQYCIKHVISQREYMRKYSGAKVRYPSCPSYQLEQKTTPS